MTTQMYSKGLKGVVAVQTKISLVDGANTTLCYRGIDVHELVDHPSFEEVCYLLLYGKAPTCRELIDFTLTLAAHRAIPGPIMELLRSLSRDTSPIDALRTAVSACSASDTDTHPISLDALRLEALRLIAQLPVFVATYHAFRSGTTPIRPSMSLGHAANTLRLLDANHQDPDIVRALDTCFILLSDHGMNASTFTARIVASTQADLYAAVTAALAALKGPLHGGASEATMRMLMEIGDPANAERYVSEALTEKRKIPGIGHRIYKSGDPRVKHLKAWSEKLGRKRGETHWYEISTMIEDAVLSRIGLPPNVDFYSAPMLYCLGIPIDLLTPMFACARIAGWCAHVIEQYQDNVLIRPESEYIGSRDQHYVPLTRHDAASEVNQVAEASEHKLSGSLPLVSPDESGIPPAVKSRLELR